MAILLCVHHIIEKVLLTKYLQLEDNTNSCFKSAFN